MFRLSTSFVLGYHGCSVQVSEKVLANEPFRPSENDYDWLGPGIYFWEANPRRGLEYFRELKARKRIEDTEAVVGAVVDLGRCLDLTSSSGISAVKAAYGSYKSVSLSAHSALPQNVLGDDLLLRKLDCAVIKHLHHIRESGSEEPFQTVRGLFREGEPLYPNSGIYEKSHIQICVLDSRCIKGVFRVRREHLDEFVS